MNLHKNARTCPNSRGLMVKRVLEERRPVVEVAEEFGVSRSTLYKWIRRYIAAGEAGLKDGSSKPVEIADGRIPAAQAIRQKYAPGVYGKGSSQGHRSLLSGIALGASSKD